MSNGKEMTTYQKCKNIRDSILTRVGEGMSYANWSDEFKLSNILDVKKSIERWEEKNGSFKINPNDLSVQEMQELGFCKWSDENPMRLIPIWLYPFLADEFESTSISGTACNTLAEIDSDHRFGCLAYGVIPKQ